MNGKHRDFKLGSSLGRCRHGIWNVVEFQVEEYPSAGPDQVAHDLGALSRKKLLADLEYRGGGSNRPHDVLGLSGSADVQGDDQSVACCHRVVRLALLQSVSHGYGLGIHDVQAHPLEALLPEFQDCGRTVGEVDDAG